MVQLMQIEKEKIKIVRTVAGSYSVVDLEDRQRFAYTVGINDEKAKRLYGWWTRLETYDEVVAFWRQHEILFEESKK